MLSFFKALDSKIINNLQTWKSKDMDLVENHYKNFRISTLILDSINTSY